MKGLWYNAVNLLEGECIRWNDKPLGKRQNQAEYHGNEKNQGIL